MALAHRLALVALIAFASFGSALAQTEVDEATLEQAFSERLPRGWSIVELAIEAQENYGTSIEPDIRSRFQASVVLNEDTFIVVSQSDDATLLQPMASAGETRTFYGVSTSRREGAGWQTTFALENDPTTGLGRPSGFFAGRTVVLGTDAEAQYRAELQTQEQAAHEAMLGQMARDERARALAREAELAETAHAVALEEAERQARREAEAAAQEHEATLAAAERAQAARELEVRQQALAALAEGLRSELQAGLANRIPAFWTVETLTLEAYEIAGTTEAPVITQTVEATVGLDADLFASVAQEGGTTLLDVVEAAGTRRTLYATVIGRWNGTFWLKDWTFESLDGLRSGQPLDQFPAQAIVIGSAEEAAWRASLEAERVQRAARLAALASALESESAIDREAAIARALVSGDEAEANLALRHVLGHTSLLTVELSLFEADADNQGMQDFLREATTALGLHVAEFDPSSGEFSGTVDSRLTFGHLGAFVGRMAGTSVTILRSPDATLVLDLDASGQLDGTFEYRGRRALRATVDLQ